MSALAKSGSEAAHWLGYQWPGTPIKSVMVEVLDQKKSKTKHHFFIGVKKTFFNTNEFSNALLPVSCDLGE